MERLTIDIPEEKSSLVRQILKELGVIIQQERKANVTDVRKSLANISVWTEEDLKFLEESRTTFENLKPQSW